MESPFTGGPVELVKELKELDFRKESFEIVYHSWKCIDTGELFTTDKLDALNVTQVHNKYRETYNIPFPDQIRNTRSKYELSARKMSEILGFGVNTYRNYEKGEVPQPSNGKLIKLAADPEEFKRLIEMDDGLDKKSRKKLLPTIDKRIEKEKRSDEAKLKQLLSEKSRFPNIYTGYREMRLDKFFNMIVYFAEQVQPFKTRLNKLMFYADFLNYKKSGFSISGANYAAIDLGPVPDAFEMLYDFLHRKKYIQIKYHEFKDNLGEQFKSVGEYPFNADLFSEEELESLDSVVNTFKDVSTEELVDKSHEEKAWKEKEGEKGLIEYDFAFDIDNI